jgi:hypothetical protein
MSAKILVALVIVFAVIGLTGVATAAWPPNTPEYDNCYALIVGISEYEGDTFVPDQGARNSAWRFYYKLIDTWGIFNPHIQLRIDSQANWNRLNNDFDTVFAGAGPNDLKIVYWAGHGGWTPDVEPFDEPDDLDGVLVTYERWRYTDDEFAEKIRAIAGGGPVIVILDSCHMEEFSRELDIEGVVVLLSTEILESTETYPFIYFGGIPVKGYMPFTYYLTNAEDTNQDGVITIEEAFAYAYPKTVAKAAQNGNSQHPIMIDNVPGDVAYLDSWG